MNEIVCPNCHKSFKPERVRRKFCSRECSKEFFGKGIPKICPQCNRSFKARKHATVYCNRSCANAATSSARLLRPDPSFIKNMDNNVAYMIGYILADGCIVTKKKKQTERMYIVIGSNDREIIESFHRRMCPDKAIHTTPTGNHVISSNNEFDIYTLGLFGIGARKSLTVDLPVIASSLMSHMIRGLFDGDGCVYFSRQKGYTYKYISFTTGSILLANSLLTHLQSVGIESFIYRDCRRDTYYIKIFKQGMVKAFYDYIYHDADLHLARKRQIFNKDIVQSA